MNTDQKLALIHTHLEAEGAGDVEAACSVYAENIEHDAVGFPGAPSVGIDAGFEPRTCGLRVSLSSSGA